jgi:hypothetical protein
MPITEFLDGFKFDPETRRVMGVAYEMARATLKFGDQTYVVHEAIAERIIALAKEGVIDPDQLCDQALNDLRTQLPPHVYAASVGGLAFWRQKGRSRSRAGGAPSTQ